MFNTILPPCLGVKRNYAVSITCREVIVSSQAVKSQSTLYTQYPFPAWLYTTASPWRILCSADRRFPGVQRLGSGLWAVRAGLAVLVWADVSDHAMRVCPNCAYYRLDGARCISALNLLSRRIAGPGRPVDFASVPGGRSCHNNLYLAALIAPIPLMIVGLVLNFSATLLAIFPGCDRTGVDPLLCPDSQGCVRALLRQTQMSQRRTDGVE